MTNFEKSTVKECLVGAGGQSSLVRSVLGGGG